MAGDAAKTVYAALASNVAVTVLKYVAAAISGSSGMLTEAIHSTADTINQLLLLYGQHRTKAPTDQTHQFGYGLETYFWTFIVGFLVLLLGGGVALYEGVAHMRAGTPVSHPGLALGVLAASAVLDGASFVFGLRMYRLIVKGERVGGRQIGLWSFIRMSKDPGLFETLLEDAAALAGVVLAVAGIVGSVWLRLCWADGLASILIGLLLVADALVIMEATRNLIAGESVAALVGLPSSTAAGGDRERRVLASPDGRYVFVSDYPSAAVVRVDVARPERQRLLLIQHGPMGMAISPDGRTLWACNHDAGTITIVDVAGMTALRDFATGKGPENAVLLA